MTTNKIYNETAFETGSQTYSGGGSVTLKTGAIIDVSTFGGLELAGGPWTIKVDGTIEADAGHGIFLDGDAGAAKAANSKVTVGTEGTVWGDTGSVGIFAQQATDVVNSGRIHGDIYGIRETPVTPSSSKSVSITNNATGSIEGANYGIYFNDASHDLVVKNAGQIFGATGIAFGHSLQLTNTGTLSGAVTALSASVLACKITNSGKLGILADPSKDAITLGGGNDTVTNTGRITGNLLMGGGNDTVTNGGEILSLVTFGSGNDKMSNSGSVFSKVDMGDGNNVLTNTGILSPVVTRLGNDTVTNTGEIYGIDLGGGDNKLTNSGTITHAVQAGTGDDVVKNTGTIADTIDLGEGDNSVANSGHLKSVTFGDGNDIMTNSGTLDLGIDMGEGNNSLTTTAVVLGVQFGDGDDYFKTTKEVLVTVTMGGGNDTFIGGGADDALFDEQGNDSYSLGGGDDLVYYGYDGTDKIDGGAGFDQFYAGSISTAGLFINLDSKAYTLSGVTAAATSLNAWPGGGPLGTIKGFEYVTGTAKADVLHGSSAAEKLIGSSGADIVIGGGGADYLGDGSDGAVDTFIYESIKDSGATKATRDTIYGFEGANKSGGDVIDLHAIDADTKQTGNQDFSSVILHDTAFTKVAGELRTVVEGDSTVLQGDVNGDGKADFTIVFSGIVALADQDLVL